MLLPQGGKLDDVCLRLDTLPQYDGRTDRQTETVKYRALHAMHSDARYKLLEIKTAGGLCLAGSILSVESNQNVESKTKNVESTTEKFGVQNSIWSVDSQENH